MRAPAVSFTRKLLLAAVMGLLACSLVPLGSAFAEGEGGTADAPAEEPQEVSAEQVDEGSGSIPTASPAEGGTLASVLVGTPTTFINSDVTLDGEPVIGSFTVDGLTFAVTEGSDVELVGVSPDWQQVEEPQEGDGSPVAPMLASGPDGLDAGSSELAVPESIAYEGVDYAVNSIGAYAFYLSGVTDVELPASIAQVDDRAFRSSDVALVTVADGNASYSSFDGALYDADQSSLLLIPEGKQGTVLLPKTAEMAPPSVFSHCSLVQAIAVEEGSAAFASENGLLYDASLATLLRVPAGATDIVIRDGCTIIAAGAMEACASLATITAPASVTSISPDVFTSVPTVSLPAVAAVADDPGASTGATEGPSEQAGSTPVSSAASTQLTAMVALSSADDDLPEVNPSAIEISLLEGADSVAWQDVGFAVGDDDSATIASMLDDASHDSATDDGAIVMPIASLDSRSTYDADPANSYVVRVRGGVGGTLTLRSTESSSTPQTGLSQVVMGTNYGYVCFPISTTTEGSDTCTMQIYNANKTLVYKRVCQAVPASGYYFAGWALNSNPTYDQLYLANDSSTRFTTTPKAWSGGECAIYAVFYPRASYTVQVAANGSMTSSGGSAFASPAMGGISNTAHRKWSATLSSTGTWGITVWQNDDPSVMVYQVTGAVVPNAGYKFAGWSASSSSSNLTSTHSASGTDGEGFSYYAILTPITYTMTLNSGSGTISDSGWTKSSSGNIYTRSFTVESTFSLPTPLYSGYAFGGWYTAATGGTQIDSTSAFPCSNVTYYAHWTKNPIYTISLRLNAGNTTAVHDTLYLWYGKGYYSTSNPTDTSAALTSISQPQRSGYAYKGFSTSSTTTVGTYWTSVTTMPSATAFGQNMTLYASWAQNAIRTITLNANGGSGGTSAVYQWTGKGWYSTSAPTDSTAVMTSLTAPTRAGYAFKGYATSATATTATYWTNTTSFPANTAFSANTTLYAVWSGNVITLAWNSNGGTAVADTTQTYSASAKVSLPSPPTRAGYAFKGWFTSTSSATQITSSTALPTSNATYHAQWTANPITLTWNANGGSAVANTTQVYSETAKVALPADPTREGYKFAGWWTAVTSGTQITNSTALPTSATTYYARWTTNPYTISYDLAGGEVSGNPTSYSIETTTFTLKNPTRAGYTFAGWSGTGLTGNTITVTISKGSSGNRTYTANWTANAITLTWNANGGSAVADTTQTYSDVAKVALPDAPVRDGYSFNGWWTAASGGTQVTTSMALPTSNAVYYAHWTLTSYSIAYELNGGVVSGNPLTYDVTTAAFTLSNPTRVGYLFAGWSGTDLDGDDNKVVTVALGSTGNRVYVAHWTPAIAADLPLEVIARIDLLNIEDQQEATGYIESRCGEPLTVADVAFESLPGASELFGVAHVADVVLEVLAAGSTSPDVSFALDASATQAPASAAAFRMGAYEERIPISYRFAIPEDVLAAIDQARFEGVTTPVCSVAYTVALASA